MDISILTNFLNQYGIAGIVIACIIIFVIGILKFFKVFNKIEKSARKPIFLILDIALAFGLTALYYVIFNISFSINYIVYSLSIVPVVLALYAVYENLGLRKLLKLIGNFIITVVANDKVKKAVTDITESVKETEDIK